MSLKLINVALHSMSMHVVSAYVRGTIFVHQKSHREHVHQVAKIEACKFSPVFGAHPHQNVYRCFNRGAKATLN